MAHAIHGYQGPCRDVHGHSYELQVTVCGKEHNDDYFAPPGFLLDFKELKQIVHDEIIRITDHKLVLSKNFLYSHPDFYSAANLMVWDMEPTAENMLLYFKNLLLQKLPASIMLAELRLYETPTSYASWKAF